MEPRVGGIRRNGLTMAGDNRTGAVAAKSDVTGRLTVARTMPESLAAEAAVLGSMIQDPVCIGQVVEYLEHDAFYRVEHQMIFDALIALYEKGTAEAIDAVLLRDELEKREQVEAVGGVEYLGKIMESVPSSANVMYYAGIVRDRMLLRDTIAAASAIFQS